MRTFTIYILAAMLAVLSLEALHAQHRANALDAKLATANAALLQAKWNGSMTNWADVAGLHRRINALEKRASRCGESVSGFVLVAPRRGN
jgi:hypothetical protein